MLVLALTSVVLSLLALGSQGCPTNSFQWNSNCYLFFGNKTGFADAEVQCIKAGGHLASIHDAFTNAVLGQEARKYIGNSATQFWIGANNLAASKVWHWTDGSALDYLDWNKGEPKNVSNLNCAVEMITHGYWVARDCYTQLPFVCMVPDMDATTTKAPVSPTAVPVTSTTTSRVQPTTISGNSSDCETGWEKFGNACYQHVSDMSWSDGESFCEQQNANLPSVHSFDELEYLTNIGEVAYRAVWTGLNSNDGGVTWQWSDGSPVDYLQWFQNVVPQPTSGHVCIFINFYSDATTAGFGVGGCADAWEVICKKPLYPHGN